MLESSLNGIEELLMRKPASEIDLNELRAEILAAKVEGDKIISHFKKMKEYYTEWEDRMNRIQIKINEASQQLGITEEEVQQYDALSDFQ